MSSSCLLILPHVHSKVACCASVSFRLRLAVWNAVRWTVCRYSEASWFPLHSKWHQLQKRPNSLLFAKGMEKLRIAVLLLHIICCTALQVLATFTYLLILETSTSWNWNKIVILLPICRKITCTKNSPISPLTSFTCFAATTIEYGYTLPKGRRLEYGFRPHTKQKILICFDFWREISNEQNSLSDEFITIGAMAWCNC